MISSKKHRYSLQPSFTLIELLVVLTIISVLSALLVPSLQAARESARSAKCQNNLRQIGMALLMYAADDTNEKLPNAWDYLGAVPPGGTNLMYWQRLANGNYLPTPSSWISPTNGVWRCPSVRDNEIWWGGGYGPSGGENGTGNGAVMNYGDVQNVLGGYGSAPLGRLTHRATTWLIGDTGRPKSSGPPGCGYYTWPALLVPFAGDIGGNGGNSQQAACRHLGKANVVMADGHLESWSYGDLATNKYDIFCQASF